MPTRIRDTVALAFLGICVLAGMVDHLTNTAALDWFRDTSQRMRSLAATARMVHRLGAAGNEIGYLALDPAPDGTFYFSLQYQMLPSVLVESTAPPFVIVRAANRASLARLQQHHLTLLGDVGNHFYLFKHEAL